MSAVLSCTENIDLNLSFTSSSWPRLELQCCNSSPITQLIPLLNSPARNPPSETPVGLLHCSLRPPVKSWFKLRRCNTSYTCPTRATGGIAGLFFFCLLGQFGTGIGVRYSMMGTRMEKGTIGLLPFPLPMMPKKCTRSERKEWWRSIKRSVHIGPGRPCRQLPHLRYT